MRTPRIRFLDVEDPTKPVNRVDADPAKRYYRRTLKVPKVLVREPRLMVPWKKPTNPVALDANNQMARGVTGYWLASSSNPYQDLSRFKRNGTPTGVLNRSSGNGMHKEFVPHSSWVQLPAGYSWLQQNTKGSIFALVFCDADDSGEIFTKGSSSGPSQDWRRSFEFRKVITGGLGTHRLFIRIYEDNPVAASLSCWVTDLPVNQWVSVCVVQNSPGVDFYINGVKGSTTYYDGNSSSTQWLHTTAFNNETYSWQHIGALFASEQPEQNVFNGLIDNLCIWNRPLSAAEVMSLHLDPYQMLIPA
jgi:hypothetical protein